MRAKKITKLPAFLKPYFWDVEFEDLDERNHQFFLIKRVLDRGDTKSVQWLLKKYSLQDIKETVTRTRDLSRQTANFWTEILSLDRKKIPCLNKPYSRIPFGRSS